MTWSPPDPLEDITGYIIYYSTDGSSDSVNVSEPDSSEAVLEDLMMASSYSISIVAVSQHLPSELRSVPIRLVLGNTEYT